MLKKQRPPCVAPNSWRPDCNPRMQRDPLAYEAARGRPIGNPKHHKPVLLQTRCPFTSLVISNIETTFLPSNTASSFSSARMLRLSLGSWSSCLRMYSQSFWSVRSGGADLCRPLRRRAARGCVGFLRGRHRAIRTRRAWLPSEKSTVFPRFAGAPRRISADSSLPFYRRV